LLHALGYFFMQPGGVPGWKLLPALRGERVDGGRALAGHDKSISSSFHQNGYKMKLMDFSVWLGARRRHSCSYGNDEEQRQADKDAISCIRFGGTDY
jgi:hypothetical protein